jgi:hypothetical protein
MITHETKIEMLTFGGLAVFAAWLWYAHRTTPAASDGDFGAPLSTGTAAGDLPGPGVFSIAPAASVPLPQIAPDVINLAAPLNATSYGNANPGCGCPASSQVQQYASTPVMEPVIAAALANAGFPPAAPTLAYRTAPAPILPHLAPNDPQTEAGYAASAVIDSVPWD